jgi:anti-anti-sigma factor
LKKERALQTRSSDRFLAVMSATELNIRRMRGDRVAVELKGEHEAYTAAKLERQLDNLLEEGFGIVVDLRQASFIDSETAGLLLAAHRRAESKGTEFRVVLGDETGWAVRSLLDITGLGAVLEVADR